MAKGSLLTGGQHYPGGLGTALGTVGATAGLPSPRTLQSRGAPGSLHLGE